MTLSGWVKALAANRFKIHPRRLAMSALIVLFGTLNSALRTIQRAVYGRRIAGTEIREAPIIIAGHWRSGTTFLHELMALDPRHTAPDTYACFAPNHFLLTRHLFPPLLSLLLPARRPVDHMSFGLDRPQEDEFALCNMGIPSPYLTMAFPNERPRHPQYLTLEQVSPRELDRWKEALRWFLRCLTLERGKRIVLKSPPHTGRIRVLLDVFPEARFIHIVRNPYDVFASTMNLWRRLFRDQGVQRPRFEGLEEYVLSTFEQMYGAFERDRVLLASTQLCEVRYEDLVADTPGQMKRIYDELRLGEFKKALPGIQNYIDVHADHQTSRHELSPGTRAEISRRWAGYIHRYGYAGPALQSAGPGGERETVESERGAKRPS